MSATTGCRARSASKSSLWIARVSARSIATTVALRELPASSSAISPNVSPGPTRFSTTVSPSGVLMRTANRPRCTRCSVSAGSPRWNTTSRRPKVRRRAICNTRRASSSGTPARIGHCTNPTLKGLARYLRLGGLKLGARDDAVQPGRDPPVALAEDLHDRRDEDEADDRGVDEHGGREPEADQLEEDLGAQGQGAEDDDQ